MFPKANVARMDRDTMNRKGVLLKTLKELKNGSIQILIGTQMVAKGHDFPNITLVGIICADLSLNFPDFRAGERTFQLLAQVAGRTGRGNTPGRVILQSYQTDHFSITAAQSQNFREFYAQEVPFRKALKYPPFSRMIQIRITSHDKKLAETHTQSISRRCHDLKASDHEFKTKLEILGPIEAPLFRIAGNYRFQMILKCEQSVLLHRFTRKVFFNDGKFKRPGKVKVDIDVDPYFML
jgi:primosomal protein N' (replication factor Y)